ncbi:MULTISPECIES: 2-amino-4-oxopentanoate thiolase subunit OrtB [Aminobacterium]|jgi:cysteine synthase|uniref:2-amino-4-oxopentanoate thiolase subunit OrtB n=1 Tax=Aminobacterium TaxID=81466 RepID=UPI00257BC29A|nr:2-amino-4-oxopentanoate thiolase subunit OrtB [Aminobacterium sp. UBA4987]
MNPVFDAVANRKNEILKKALGIDYSEFELPGIAFDYEGMMGKTGYTLEEIRAIQAETNIGNTPMLELRNLTAAARALAGPGKGARIFLKDEATNPSGSFKARRAAMSCYYAQQKGYAGVIAASSGNYGAAVASQANMRNLKAIIVQELFDSRHVGQPEILEKGRISEAFGAEVVQLTVGPELFIEFLRLLDETGYCSASLYSPFAIAGIETLGDEIATQIRQKCGRDPDAVVITNAGGGNLTGTARGLIKAGCSNTQIVAASVDITGLHMASDKAFNRKSFTTGHTGFGMPFSTWPDRTDVPRNAARSLRYTDRYVLVSQGEVFYMTEALAQLEGLERGPAGNTSLTAAFALAQEMDRDQVVVIQETEYTGAGKHVTAQLSFAREQLGIEVRRGNPEEQIPGKNIIIPENPGQVKARDISLDDLRRSYCKNVLKMNNITKDQLTNNDIKFMAEDTKTTEDYIRSIL